MLSEQLQQQIEQEAKSSAADFNYFPGSEECEDLESAYTTGSTKYAEKWQESETEIKQLNKVLNSALTTSEKAIEKLQAAEQRAERYEKALKQIEQMSDPGDYWKAIIDMKAIATKALTPKTTNDDTDHG